MKRFRIIGLALLALFALGAIASSTAFAGEEGFLPIKGKTGEAASPKEGKLNLVLETTAHLAIECVELDPSVFTFTNDHHATGTLHFLKCKSGGFAINSLGDKSEIILVPVLVLICLINSAALLFGLAVEVTPELHLEQPVTGALIGVTGTAIGDILPVAGNPKLWVVHFRGKLGAQEVTDCIEALPAGKLLTHNLKSELNHNGKPEAASEQADPVHLTFPENVELMDK